MVFKRIRDLTMATIHEGLDAVENPVQMLNQYLRDMEEEIDKAEKAIVKQMMIEKRFEQEENEARKIVDKRTRQATLAVEAGEENLARRALQDKKQYDEKIEHYRDLKAQAGEQVLELKEQLKDIKEKYNQMRDRKYELISRANAAKTKKQMNQAVSKFDTDAALKGFKRMEERILEWETEAKVKRVGQGETYEDRLSALEPDEDIERELAAIKERNTSDQPAVEEGKQATS